MAVCEDGGGRGAEQVRARRGWSCGCHCPCHCHCPTPAALTARTPRGRRSRAGGRSLSLPSLISLPSHSFPCRVSAAVSAALALPLACVRSLALLLQAGKEDKAFTCFKNEKRAALCGFAVCSCQCAILSRIGGWGQLQPLGLCSVGGRL